MDKTTRYYVVILWSFRLLVLYILFTIFFKISEIYLVQFTDLTQIINIVMGFIRTFLLIGFFGGLAYIIYACYIYVSSTFYIATKIPISKALYFGYFDLAYAYDRFNTHTNEIEIDPKHKALIVRTKKANYFVLVREYFGKIDGSERNDSWKIVKGKKKEYGRVDYRIKIPVANPLFELRDLKIALEKKYNETYQGYIAITGFTNIPFTSDAFLNVFQVEGLLE